MKTRIPRKSTCLIILLIATIGVLIVTPLLGMKTIPLSALFGPEGGDSDIFWKIRLPRVITSFIAGAGLAVSGMVFQAIFRNLLATPFTLGVASGASLGAAVYVRLGLAFSLPGLSGISVFAFAGAVLSIAIVYGLTRIRQGLSTSTMLLAGVAISFFFSSLILFIQYMSNFIHSFRIVRWLMGTIKVVGFDSAVTMAPFVLTGGVIVFALSHELNLLMMGEEISTSRGVNVNKTKAILFFAVSLMVGSIVAVCGPIGFVGMMAPHICRLIIGADHRKLAPATILFGGIFLTVADTVARTLIAPAEMPVGVITALIGGPFFIWLLMSRSSSIWDMR
ncbi:MAG: iron ABC transporter permease [Deltaproteobacteria bacterium]|nr:iron ABC transporter permease [Deltaproteobacteria bacterium]